LIVFSNAMSHLLFDSYKQILAYIVVKIVKCYHFNDEAPLIRYLPAFNEFLKMEGDSSPAFSVERV
jgi:hypothetical protein